MFSGFYTIASGLLSRQREIDVLSNNLVNMQTPGYRASRVVIGGFEKELLTRQEAYSRELLNAGVGTPAAVVTGEVINYETGLIKQTGRANDVAINGSGFFTVQNEEGQTYLTRNGGFDVDAEGYLCIPGIGRVLGENGSLLQVGTSEFQVDVDGSIWGLTGEQAGQQLGAIQVLEPVNYDDMVQNEQGLFETEGLQMQQPQNYNLVQGSLEQSNVNLSQELSYLIEAQRAYQSCSSAMQIVDQMNQKAVTQIAAL